MQLRATIWRPSGPTPTLNLTLLPPFQLQRGLPAVLQMAVAASAVAQAMGAQGYRQGLGLDSMPNRTLFRQPRLLSGYMNRASTSAG